MSVVDDLFGVRGRVALVTGGASGLGYAFASILADCGAVVVVADWNAERLEKAVAALSGDSGATVTGARVNRMRSWAFILAAGIAGIAGIAYAGTNGTVDPTAGSSLILPAYAAVFLGATAIKPGRINALGALIAVYFLAAGTAGLELLGTANYIQQIFYGAALVAAVTIPKATRDRVLKRKRSA